MRSVFRDTFVEITCLPSNDSNNNEEDGNNMDNGAKVSHKPHHRHCTKMLRTIQVLLTNYYCINVMLGATQVALTAAVESSRTFSQLSMRQVTINISAIKEEI